MKFKIKIILKLNVFVCHMALEDMQLSFCNTKEHKNKGETLNSCRSFRLNRFFPSF